MEERYTISLEKMNEILSRANYWNEVNHRREGNTTEILYSELREVVASLGLSTLWILEDWAKDLRRRDEEVNNIKT